jgi:serine/threonine-protein phosphatase 2A activator
LLPARLACTPSASNSHTHTHCLVCLHTHTQLLPPHLAAASLELLPYWLDSWGNPTRIDYGTGHETTFVGFLFCLAALGLVTQDDRAALVCVVFNRCARV